MRTIVKTTDADIRAGIEDEVIDLEENDMIAFPDTDAREQFIQECTEQAIETCELNAYYEDNTSRPDYASIVFDAAQMDGYLTEDV